jgi:hypothetical protein
VELAGLDELFGLLGPPKPDFDTYALIPLKEWTTVFNNSYLGTDLGMIPSLAARKLGCRALRVVAKLERQDAYPATILELYDPSSTDPLKCRRAIAAADDGGVWRFIQYGEPLAFEEVDAYSRRRIRDRLTPEMLRRYLLALGVPPVSPENMGLSGTTLLKKSSHQ